MSTRRALCIGIDDYPGPQSLNGCVTDAWAWSSVLRDILGFADGDVELLIDKSATGRNILASIQKLLSITQPDDVAVVTISCLGSNVVHEDESEMPAICPYDVEADWVELDALAALTASATAGSRITIVLDATFTGRATRSFEDRVASDDRRARFLSPAVFGRPHSGARSQEGGENLDWAAMVILAGLSYQYAYEAFIDGQYRGALSHAATKLLRATGGKLTEVQFIRQVADELAVMPFAQTPVAIGARSRRRMFT